MNDRVETTVKVAESKPGKQPDVDQEARPTVAISGLSREKVGHSHGTCATVGKEGTINTA